MTGEQSGEKVSLDLHSGNIMMRSNWPVVTDPFA